jgi:nitrile hydratase alpha subunit
MPHDGPHHHGHDHAPDDPSFASRPAIGARALRELLEEAGVLAPGEVARQVERMDTITPALGARVVARAWVDPEFKARLLADGSAAVRAFGVEMGATPLHVVENTETVHNMIVCTLCSCYPKSLLGIPPDWYKSFAYRSRAVREPRAVLAEFGVRLPDGVSVRVHDSTADLRYLVLPRRPEGTEGWDEARLAEIVSRDCMIGTALPSG